MTVAACSAHGTSSTPDKGTDRPDLAVTGAYVPEPPMADMAAGYLTVANTGRAADRLTSVTSDIATDVTMHSTTSAGAMKKETALPVPAGGRLVLSTGGDHLMLMGLKRKPKASDTVTFVLRFAASPPITVKAPVKPATYRPDQ
ncbi:copper chaperone PCu(A)C [Actinomadura nitritigenes]|uniref:copper chaperone PCu(A)C n=1 Tax=Actinomadura nitritigenes TaxID=134602 RepID=UPI003D9402A4